MDPLLILVALWLLYGVALGVQRLLAARRRRMPPAGARRRPPGPDRPAPRRPVVSPAWEAPEEVGRREPPDTRPRRAEAPAPAGDWRRRLAQPEALREAVVAAEILRRPRPGGLRAHPRD